LSLLVAGLLILPGYAQSNQGQSGGQKATGKLSQSDQNFLKQAAEGNLAEVQLGQLGQQKGTSSEVKQLAQALATDHQQNQQKLQSLAQKEGVTLPTAPLPKDKAATDKLSKLSGSAFDKAFAQHAVMEHQKDIAQFKHEESMTKNSDVKGYAGETLSKLQQHLQLAQNAEQKAVAGTKQ
jgi:putative membrane protein